jgi:MFS family permease
MVGSILAYSVFSGCCYFAQSPAQLGFWRFLSAVGMGGEWSLGVALVMECWPEKHRPLLAGAIGAASNVGFGLLGIVGMLWHVTRDSWRWVMLAGAAPALLALFIARYVPESKRWKEAKAAPALDGPLKQIWSRGLWKSTSLGIVFAAIALIGTWGSVQWLPAWADQMTQGQGGNAKGVYSVVDRHWCDHWLLCRRWNWRSDGTSPGILYPLPQLAAGLRCFVPYGAHLRPALPCNYDVGRRLHRGNVWLAAALLAGIVSNLGEGHRSGGLLQ